MVEQSNPQVVYVPSYNPPLSTVRQFIRILRSITRHTRQEQ